MMEPSTCKIYIICPLVACKINSKLLCVYLEVLTSVLCRLWIAKHFSLLMKALKNRVLTDDKVHFLDIAH